MQKALLAIQVVSRGDLACQRMLIKMGGGFPGQDAFIAWLHVASHLGLTGPQLVALRAELGSDCELICSLMAKVAKRSRSPMIMLAMTEQIECIRSRMTW